MARAETLTGADAGQVLAGQPDSPGRSAGAVHGLTVHVVGRFTAPVVGFLLPTLTAMHAVGTPQALLYVDDSYARQTTAALPSAVTLRPVPDGSALRRTQALHAALASLSGHSPVSVLHLHGLLPGLAAVRWLHGSSDRSVEVFFSPHGSRALTRTGLLRALLAWLLRHGLGTRHQHAIVNLRPEAELLAPFGRGAVQLIESPVPQVFFDTPRHEARRPLLVSCNLAGQRAAVDRFARIAVLLNDDKLGISFNWVGDAEPEATAALKAAGVGQFAAATDASRAQRLGTAWVYVAPTQERGFPVRLAEAMAAGLPCVALDTAVHRSVLDHGETGYLCSDLQAMLQTIAMLLDSGPLRDHVGRAARQAATARFSEPVFRQRLLQAVGTGTPPSATALPGDR